MVGSLGFTTPSEVLGRLPRRRAGATVAGKFFVPADLAKSAPVKKYGRRSRSKPYARPTRSSTNQRLYTCHRTVANAGLCTAAQSGNQGKHPAEAADWWRTICTGAAVCSNNSGIFYAAAARSAVGACQFQGSGSCRRRAGGRRCGAARRELGLRIDVVELGSGDQRVHCVH
jgi:hypothetical protein